MGHITTLSDYEMERGDSRPVPEGVDIEAARKSNVPKEHMSESEMRGNFDDEDEKDEKTVRKSKVVTPKKKNPSVTTTAVVKDAK